MNLHYITNSTDLFKSINTSVFRKSVRSMKLNAVGRLTKKYMELDSHSYKTFDDFALSRCMSRKIVKLHARLDSKT